MSEEIGICAVCNEPAKQLCSACKSINYCGTDHQKKHWKIHKLECRLFAIGVDEELGRYLLAKQNIKANTAIFHEKPLIVGPKWYLSEGDENCPIVPCVGCYQPCQIGIFTCPRCNWPACSPKCEALDNMKLHAFDCSILRLGPGPLSDCETVQGLNEYYRMDALMVLKCLLLQTKNPKKWSELMDMQSHEEERFGSELYRDADKRIVSYLQKNYLQPLKTNASNLNSEFVENLICHDDVLHKICGIIETNYMCININNGLELSGIFYSACMMEHTCSPNCYFEFDHKNGFKITVKAGKDLKIGEHLKIMYSNMIWGTQMRNEHLQMTKHFICKCTRCTDPTELGTYFSALKCVGDVSKDCDGIQLPKDPLSSKTDWICNKCPMLIQGEHVRFLLTQMNEEIEDMFSEKPTINKIETMIAKLSKFLHSNHYHLFSLKHSLIQLYGTEINYMMPDLSDELISRKMIMCKELLKICDTLDPYTIRLSIYVGIILFEMYRVLLEQGNRHLKNESKKSEAIENFKEAKECLIRGASDLSKATDNVAGAKLRETLFKKIEELQPLIENSSNFI